MKAHEFSPPKHLCADDLNGVDTVVTIESYTHEVVGQKQEKCGTLKFKEFDRTFVVNRTNLARLVEWYGKELDNWIGKPVTLYESEASFGNVVKPCIRVRSKK